MNLQRINSNTVILITNIPEDYRNKFLKAALLAWQTPSKNRNNIIENFSKNLGMSKFQIYEILGVYIGVIKLFLQSSHSDFSTKMTELGFSSDFISKLSLFENEKELVNSLRQYSADNFPKISVLKWKIDISLVNSVILKRCPKPVTLCLTLNNGEKYTIRVDLKMFHKLRFNIAMMLKELSLAKTYSTKTQSH